MSIFYQIKQQVVQEFFSRKVSLSWKTTKLNSFFSQSGRNSNHFKIMLKSVQSALSHLLTTSATHGTFSRPSTKRGLILIGLEVTTNARESFEHC